MDVAAFMRSVMASISGRIRVILAAFRAVSTTRGKSAVRITRVSEMMVTQYGSPVVSCSISMPRIAQSDGQFPSVCAAVAAAPSAALLESVSSRSEEEEEEDDAEA